MARCGLLSRLGVPSVNSHPGAPTPPAAKPTCPEPVAVVPLRPPRSTRPRVSGGPALGPLPLEEVLRDALRRALKASLAGLAADLSRLAARPAGKELPQAGAEPGLEEQSPTLAATVESARRDGIGRDCCADPFHPLCTSPPQTGPPFRLGPSGLGCWMRWLFIEEPLQPGLLSRGPEPLGAPVRDDARRRALYTAPPPRSQDGPLHFRAREVLVDVAAPSPSPRHASHGLPARGLW